ncbi:hypothetical protein BUALT_Bualt16G0053900 [Buddleja alternifolia]|uniref:GIY-YIG domain-containing protein n=1 Tax=Buddleja alternifolia TaxID=168488 RepID=A0AAV6W9G0_9LAMI|nr:hypothetical protein BUALT_Bualt16G0053900 [Buddleja alternifolia]
MGKEGAERYRTQNLPNCTRCPGVYELGVTIQCSARAGLFLELDPTFIYVLYVGETDDVRTRLQQYGRNGAHLKKLFSEIFSKGRLAIVYRWAYMKSKKDAQETEAQLLKENDYPWNEKSNGERRPVDDVHRKLECCLANNTSQFSLLHKIMLQYLHQKQVDIKLNLFQQFLIILCKSILNASWLQPTRGVQSCCGDDRNRIGNICGVCIGHGSVCTKPPVKGRKRCAEHKGMKVIGFIS